MNEFHLSGGYATEWRGRDRRPLERAGARAAYVPDQPIRTMSADFPVFFLFRGCRTIMVRHPAFSIYTFGHVQSY